MPKPRTLKDLNPKLYGRNPKRVQAFVEAANMINDWQGSTNPDYYLGDLLLFKLNFLKAGCRPRKMKR